MHFDTQDGTWSWINSPQPCDGCCDDLDNYVLVVQTNTDIVCDVCILIWVGHYHTSWKEALFWNLLKEPSKQLELNNLHMIFQSIFKTKILVNVSVIHIAKNSFQNWIICWAYCCWSAGQAVLHVHKMCLVVEKITVCCNRPAQVIPVSPSHCYWQQMTSIQSIVLEALAIIYYKHKVYRY